MAEGPTKTLLIDSLYAVGIYDDGIYDENSDPVPDKDGNPAKALLKNIVLWLLFGGIFFTSYLKFIAINK